MGSLIWCFVFAIARVWGQCCNSVRDYCPPESTFSLTSMPTSCTSFGTGHIHTFDGFSYDFHEYGDFWLVNSATFGVQARQIDCKTTSTTQSVPISSTTQLQGTCNKAFVILVNGNYYEFRHDINADYINVSASGVVQAPQPNPYNFGSLQATVRPLQYVNPYQTTWRDQQSYLPDADFSVSISVTAFGPAISINIIFYATGHATIQVILPANSGVPQLQGLCGYRDGCVANDLYLRPNPTFNPSPNAVRDALPNIEIVTPAGSGTSGNGVTAGSLSAGSRFINNTNDGNKWVSVFGTTWKVPTSETKFQSVTGSNYNIRSVSTSYSNGGNSCNWPDGWNIPQFIQSQCSLDKNIGPDQDGIAQFPTKHVLFFYCQYYCSNFVFPFRHPQLLASSCNGICEFPQGDLTQDLHTVYDATNLPSSFLGTNKPQALFTSTMNLGGTYTFGLVAADSCAPQVFNVSYTIHCNSGLSLDAPASPSTPSTNVSRNKWYGYPQVVVVANPPKNYVRSSWAIVTWPNNVTAAPTLNYVHSLSPSFVPAFPGLYQLEFAAYDGCKIVKQVINITTQCASCVTASIIDTAPVKEVMWELSFDSPSKNPVLAVSFPTKTLNSVVQGQDWPQWGGSLSFNWSIVSDDNSADVVQQTATVGQYNVNRYNNSDVANYARSYPNGQTLNDTDLGWGNVTITPGSIVRTSLQTLPSLPGPIGTVYGSVPPQREFPINREGNNNTQTNTTSRNKIVTTYWQQAVGNLVCQAAIATGTAQSATVTFTSQGAPQDNFIPASRCVGQYNLNLSVSEFLCSSSVDVQKISVECGPVPEVYLSCPTETTYVYTRAGVNPIGFPTVQVSASLSSDPYVRPLTYRYIAVSKPATSAMTDPLCNFPTGCPSSAALYNPDLAGTYQIQVLASNGCNFGTGLGTFRAVCPGDASSITATFSFPAWTNSQVPYSGQSLTNVATMDSTGSVTTTTGATLDFSWTLVSSPTPNSFPTLPVAGITPSLFPGATASLSMNLDGPYSILMTANQGCGQTATVQKDITLLCDAAVTPSFTPTGNLDVTWSTTVPGWTPVQLTPSTFATTFAFTNNPTPAQGATLGQYYWYRNGVFFSNLQTAVTLTPPASNLTENVTLWATDGCKYAQASPIFITYHCFTGMDAVITPNQNVANLPTNTQVQFSANNSVFSGAPTIYNWAIVSSPSNLQGSLPTFGNTQVITWTPLWGGDYILQLTITDGCASSSVNLTVTVVCTVSLPLSARYLVADGTTPPTIIWNRNNFAQVYLDSNLTRPTTITGLAYEWRVLSAPLYSIYYANSYTTSIITNISSLINVSVLSADGNYMTIAGNTTFTETNTSFMSYVTLLNRQGLLPTAAFPACFYPDIPGTYKVQLTVSDTCQTQTSIVSVPVDCASAPTPVLSVSEHALFNPSTESSYVGYAGSNTWRVQLSRAGPRRVLLDARQSQNYSFSQLTYYWGWANPDSRAGTNMSQDSIETPYASTSALEITSAGTKYLYLTVHDGCDVSYLNFTLQAICSSDPPTLGPNVTVNSDGTNLNTFDLSLSNNNGGQITCAQIQWTLNNFTPTSYPATGSACRAVLSLITPLLFALLSIYFRW